ncbi:hypothetical protein [Streptomyces prunicolor]|uniref:hypothetical protein n=1 Tax=Streptomyces prunicolor TaxID=67348 RepID=UPI0003643285|nr:hypothetical protein [Streptomyces prunicolor]
MTDVDPTWVYTVLACEQDSLHQQCTEWRWTSEHPDGARGEAVANASALDHARVLRHPEGYPMHKSLAYEHRAGGGPCAACTDGRGPCADTPADPLFLCPNCLALLDHELRHALLSLGLPDPGPRLAYLAPETYSLL